MKNVLCFLILTLSCLMTSCERDRNFPGPNGPNFEGFYVFEGTIANEEDLPMENMEVELLVTQVDDGGDGWWSGYVPNLAKVAADADGFYSISYDKQKLYNKFRDNDHLYFSLKFSYKDAISTGKFNDQTEKISIDFGSDLLILDKQMNSGGMITVVKRDDPTIEYTTDSEAYIVPIFRQKNNSSTYVGNSGYLNESDTLTRKLRVDDEFPLAISWKVRDNNANTYHVASDTIQIEYGEEYIYWIDY